MKINGNVATADLNIAVNKSSVIELQDAVVDWPAAFDAIQTAICLVDLKGRILCGNRAMAELLHREPEDLRGQTCFGLMHGTECPIHDCPVERMARSRQRERLIVEKNGRWFEAVADPLFDPAGELAGAVHILVDITDRRETEMELGRLRQELHHMSRVSAMGELAATLAHELNQPLTAILANAQALQQSPGPTDGNTAACLSDIVAEDQRAAEIIRRIRAMVTKQTRVFSPVDFNEVVREVAALVHGLALARRVSLALDLAANLPPVQGDPIQLQQVVMNLLLNAIEAMSAPDIRRRDLTVRTELHGTGGLLAVVEDTGPGLPPVDEATLFATFYTTKAMGMGMGLAICRSILQNHGGRIRAGNRPGGGAAFRIELPAAGGPPA